MDNCSCSTLKIKPKPSKKLPLSKWMANLPKPKKIVTQNKGETDVPKLLSVFFTNVNQVHSQLNQVNRKIMTKDINFLQRVQKPWRYKWKKYSKRVNKQQKHLRDYMMQFCEDHPGITQFLMELMKVRFFVTQRSNKFLIILSNSEWRRGWNKPKPSITNVF